MIVYFANRNMEIMGKASTNLRKGVVIVDDNKVEDVETGVATFECSISVDEKRGKRLEVMAEPGNYLLRKNGHKNEFYTIIDSEYDTKKQEVWVYAEDAGLDLLNEIAGVYAAEESHGIEHYVEYWTEDSGFEIGINECPKSTTRKLSWEGESTVTERLASIATQFGGYEISFSFEIKCMEVTHKYINIYKQRGKDTGVQLRLNREIDRIITKKSVANLATAFYCTGGIPEDSDTPITLKGYQYDDGDFFVDEGGVLRSRKAAAKWSRYVWNKEPNKLDGYAGHIERTYSYDTTSQQTLCAHAITELKKVCDMEVNYEAEFKRLPDSVEIGDRVNIVDDAGELYLSSRLLKLSESETRQEHTATIGEHLIKDSGISQKIADLAAQLANTAQAFSKAQKLAESAQEVAQEAQIQADEAERVAQEAQTEAAKAIESANDAQESAKSANEQAKTAQGVAADAQNKATTAQETAAAAKVDAEQAKKDVENLGSDLETLSNTMTADYARKTELTETTASLQSQITQNAAEISSTAKKVVEIDETANNAAGKADLAQTAAQNAQNIANAAASNAQAAQKAANDATETATEAQSIANSAKDLADSAQTVANESKSKLEAAEAELESAKSNLEAVTSRVDATEEEIQAAQTAVNTAQAAADKAKTDAANAQATADKAKEDAATAQNAADTAKQAADDAQEAADTAQEAADKAQKDVAALAVRVSTAETNITQNAEQIALMATKEEVTKTLGGYYTKTETEGLLKVQSDSITARVEAVEESSEDLITRLASAEQKITPEAIVSTVSGTYVTKDDASNAYATKSSVSEVKQTVDGLTVTTGNGSTLINGGKIDTLSLFAQDITATGSITGARLYGTHIEAITGKIGGFALANNILSAEVSNAYISPGYTEALRILEYSNHRIEFTDKEIAASDLNGDGLVNVKDAMFALQASLGTVKYSDLAGAKTSTVKVKIDPINVNKVIHLIGTNAWGRDIESYLGIDGLKVLKVTAEDIRLDGSMLIGNNGMGLGEKGLCLNMGSSLEPTVLFGINDSQCISGNTEYSMNMFGSGTRPTYNGDMLALFKDISGEIDLSGYALKDHDHDGVYAKKTDLAGYALTSHNHDSVYATKTELNKKADDFSIEIYNGTAGNPKPVRFASFNYSTCGSEEGIAAKISMVSGHGNGSSYAFLQDAIIRVTHTGGVEVDNFKHYGANAGTYDGANRQYGDIFWLHDTTNKIVDFYCLMGQYARVYQTPWKRLTYSSKGSVTQYTNCTVYSSGTKVWANNSEYALTSHDHDSRYLPLSGGTVTGPVKINGAEVGDGSGQSAMLKVLSTNAANAGGWIGRAMIGAKNLTFLMGCWNGLAGIGAHSWSDAAAGTGAAWAPMYFNPDGNSPMYFGANGVGWTAGAGTLVVQGSTTEGGGSVTANGKLTATSGAYISGRYQGSGDDEGLIIGRASNSFAGLTLGDASGVHATLYLLPDNSTVWRWNNGSASYDIKHPGKAGTIALTSDLAGYALSNHTHNEYALANHAHSEYLPMSGGLLNGSLKFQDSSMPGKALQFVCGIDAFANGGELGWQSKADFLAGYATTSQLADYLPLSGTAARATADGSGNNIVGTYATKSELSGYAPTGHTHEYLPLVGGSLSGDLEFSNASSWIKAYLLAFKNADTNANPTYPYTGFYQWGDEWQVNARDANNTYAKNVMAINLVSGVANFAARPTVNGGSIALTADLSSYALTGHNHDSVYAPLSHDHDSVYAKITDLAGYSLTSHDHDSVYAKKADLSSYALSGHNHDGTYAPATHQHAATDITSGVLPLAYGGTGAALSRTGNAIIRFSGSGNYFSKTATGNGAMYATSANGTPKFGTLPIAQGGTGATDAATARTNFEVYSKSEVDSTFAKNADLSSYSLTSHDHDGVYAPLSHDHTYLTLVGGTITNYLNVGDYISLISSGSVSAESFALRKYGSTNASTYVARRGENEEMIFGWSNDVMQLLGSEDRPTYNGSDIALYSDLSDYLPLSGGTVDGSLTATQAVYLNKNVYVGGTLSVKDGVGSIDGNGYVTGTWLKSTADTALSSAASEICVKQNGWIYTRTPAQILSDIGAAAASHDHDGVYAKTTDLSSYSLTSHNHDGVYAPASHNHDYLPLAGGNLSGHVYLTGANATSSTGNTSQLVFGTSSDNHVAISSNNDALVINPTVSSTSNQIVLYLNQQSVFPSGISANVTGNLTGTASRATADGNGNNIVSTYATKAELAAAGGGGTTVLDRIAFQDTRRLNQTPLETPQGVSVHLKENVTDGVNDGGSYHPVLVLRPWHDISGGPYGQITTTQNGNLYWRVSTAGNGSSWDGWQRAVKATELSNYSLTSHDHDSRYLPLSGGTLTGTLVAPVYKSDSTPAAIKPSDSNEINFGSNASYIYFGYENRVGSAGAVADYYFGTHSGAANAKKGRIWCGTLYEDGTALSDKYAKITDLAGYSLTSHNHEGVYAKIATANTYNGEQKFQNSSYCPTVTDTAPGVGCAFKASRGMVNELLADKFIMTASTGKIPFYAYTGTDSGQMLALTEVASITATGCIITGSAEATAFSGLQSVRKCYADNDHVNTAGFIINADGASKFIHRWGDTTVAEDAYFSFDATGYKMYASGIKGTAPGTTPTFEALQNADRPTFKGAELALRSDTSDHTHQMANIIGLNDRFIYYDGAFTDLDSRLTSHKHSCEELWDGNWSSGDITVGNTSNYRLYIITTVGRSDGSTQGTTILAIRNGNYIRGIGGYENGTPTDYTYHFAATVNGDTWTFVGAGYMYHTASGNHSARTLLAVAKIEGVM